MPIGQALATRASIPAYWGSEQQEAWPEIWDIIKPLIDQVLQVGEGTWSEDQLIPIYRNGKIEDVYWTFSYSPVNDESGQVAGVLVTCSETTGKVNTFKSLEESNRRYYNNIMQAPVAMCIFRGVHHTIEIANQLMLELWGNTAEHVINKPIFEVLPQAKGQGLEQIMDAVYVTGEKFVASERLVKLPRNGKIASAYINFVYEPLRESDGAICGIIAIAVEVTQQVVARKKAEDRENEFSQLTNALSSIVWTTDPKGRQTFASKRWKEFTGLDPYDVTTFMEIVHPADLESILHTWTNCLASGEIYKTEVRLKSKNGDYQWFFVNGEPVKNETGEIEKWIGTFTNINEQKKTGEYLTAAFSKIEESNKKFRNTVKQAPFGITILHGPDFIVEMANDAYLQVVDRKAAEFVGRPLFESLPEVEETVHPLLDSVLETGIPFHGIEYPVPVNRYGKHELSYFDFLYYPLREDNGKISDIIVTVIDVSASVNAKHLLKESEKQLRDLLMRSPIPMTIFRGNDHVIEIANSVMFEKIWRRKEADVLGRKLLDAFPELKTQKYPELLNTVYATGESHREFESVAYLQGDDGLKKFYVDFEFAPFFEKDGSKSGIIATINDVTEKVEARQLLKESAERLVLATEGTQLSTWDLNLQTSDILHSPRLAQIFGYGETKILTHAQMRGHIHPEDLHTIVEKAFEKALQTGTYYYEARIIHPDKTVHWIRTRGKVIFDDGKPVRMLGTLMDITDSRIAKENTARMAAIVHSSDDAIISKSLDGIITSWNAGAARIFGYTEEEMIGQPITKLIPADRGDEEPNILRRLKKGERVDHFETKRITKDKKILDVSLTISPIRDVKWQYYRRIEDSPRHYETKRGGAADCSE